VSSNGSQSGSGIVWASCPDQADANHQTVHGILRAFDANDLTTELWDSTIDQARDDVGNYAKFCPPIVANGKVYQASFSGVLNVYGLLSPPSGGCPPSLDSTNMSFGTGGGTGAVLVSAPENCSWSAGSNDSWLSITSGSGGSGAGSVNFSVDLNEGPTRTGSLTVAGQIVTVTQTSGCWFNLSPSSQSFGLNGGAGSVTATGSDPACPWTASSSATWLTIKSRTAGTGSTTVTYSVAPWKKKNKTRTATLNIGASVFSVTQSR
ncbi:MAG TPA: BACON domain-containing carbohydrate-binding protein, partial [Blastocatellia bacterium]|nr:BACON domain-containing carbohydrate-binding protein [Blastocatellia bacterium]